MVKVLVVSDIHAHDDAKAPTYATTEPPRATRNQNPVRDLLQWARDSQIEADYLMCPGDLAHIANTPGISYAWNILQELADQIGSKLIAVPGNHDVITHKYSADPRASLKSLVGFPTDSDLTNLEFWQNGWAIFEDTNARILIVDSTLGFPKHPRGTFKDPAKKKVYFSSLDKGFFSDEMEESIDDYLKRSPRRLNIALIHHHPVEHQHKRYMQDGYGPMHGGNNLIDLLSRYPDAGRWVILHGHKHIPLLTQATTHSSHAPFLLAAGSVASHLWAPANTITRNQIHLLDVQENRSLSGAGSLIGIVSSYTWGMGIGWKESERTASGLPTRSGFGCVEESEVIVAKIAQLLDDRNQTHIQYSELVSEIPLLNYQLPFDFEQIELRAEALGIEFMKNRKHQLTQVIRSGI